MIFLQLDWQVDEQGILNGAIENMTLVVLMAKVALKDVTYAAIQAEEIAEDTKQTYRLVN